MKVNKYNIVNIRSLALTIISKDLEFVDSLPLSEAMKIRLNFPELQPLLILGFAMPPLSDYPDFNRNGLFDRKSNNINPFEALSESIANALLGIFVFALAISVLIF